MPAVRSAVRTRSSKRTKPTSAARRAIERTTFRLKTAVLARVEREGRVRSFHLHSEHVTAQMLKPIIVSQVNKASYLMTDEALVYPKIGDEFAGHGTVNHSAEEYVRSYFWHTNTVENYFSIFKRGIYGCYFHVS